MKRQNNPAGAPEKPCPRCDNGYIMTGRQAEFQARSAVDNTPICVDCKLQEIVNGSV